ncbi:hypothetical protein [Mycolicibacterium holsaticum]|uniref:Uncharacterized protein n=1 Tax=Mycolicibacterium holsaticum TaxID=152142 RepID=A0A1E3R494_9MYCO|nr:hypothetical protein [Mycolicibacterium holsaticum]ODQ84644.1 hypothetical protein BHQ17_26430 [Mycolicibacterium holsaticum]
MAEKFDAASRLAEGVPTVDAVQNYVWACRMLGYEHPDLTTHAAQVRERYASEEGLNLAALDEDCAALQAVVTATEEALARQDSHLVALTAAWHGRGADASREFLRRHGEASARATAAVRTAAHGLAELRDKLWQSVDGKVSTVLAIDNRDSAQRADWLAAAQTVTTGAGDRAVASELVDHEVKPFVANVIGGEWVTAMRAAVDAIEAAYDAATAELASEADAVFDVPGDLGPTWTPPVVDGGVASAPAVGSPAPNVVPVAPAAWSGPAPAAGVPPAAAPYPAAAPPPLPAAAPAGDPAAMAPALAPPPMPSLGGGLPEMGSGLSGFAQQLGETLGALLGGSDGALAEPVDIEPPELDEPPESGEHDEEAVEDPEDELDEDAEDAEEAGEADGACEAPPENPAPQEDEMLAEEAAAAPASVPTPPEAVPPPIPEPPPESPPLDPGADAGTPCEVAADELPQVGE